MSKSIQQILRQSPMAYGVLFAILPLMLGLAVGPMVGFGPCGPRVPSSIRLAVTAAGILAISCPFISSWLFWISFRSRRIITAAVALPLLSGSIFVCLYWFFIVVSAVA
jgi:hypothetical protein